MLNELERMQRDSYMVRERSENTVRQKLQKEPNRNNEAEKYNNWTEKSEVFKTYLIRQKKE